MWPGHAANMPEAEADQIDSHQEYHVAAASYCAQVPKVPFLPDWSHPRLFHSLLQDLQQNTEGYQCKLVFWVKRKESILDDMLQLHLMFTRQPVSQLGQPWHARAVCAFV